MKLSSKLLILTMVIFSNPSFSSDDYVKLGTSILSDLVAIESTAGMGLATEVSELSKTLLLNIYPCLPMDVYLLFQKKLCHAAIGLQLDIFVLIVLLLGLIYLKKFFTWPEKKLNMVHFLSLLT